MKILNVQILKDKFTSIYPLLYFSGCLFFPKKENLKSHLKSQILRLGEKHTWIFYLQLLKLNLIKPQ